MKFKLDENFGASIQKLFHSQGYDCLTVRDENLFGADDPQVLEAAKKEKRVLVTMDHGFSNVLVYPPGESSGIAVINPPGRASLPLLRTLILTLLNEASQRDISGRLWIVEPGRIREHEPEDLTG